MNVLIVHPCKGFYGGAEEVVVQFANYLNAQEWRSVRIISKDIPREMRRAVVPQVPIIESRGFGGLRYQVRDHMEWTDVICCFNFPATLMTFPTKKPVVWYCNEPPELFTNWKRKPVEAFNRWWVRKSGMKCAVADQVQAHRFSSIYEIEPKVIPYGVDYNFWSQGKVASRSNGRLRMLQVGTITPYKNQLESVTTLYELVKQGVDATLTLAGSFTADSKYFLEIHNYVKSASEKYPDFWKRVSYTGQITQEQVRDLFHNHDILLHPVKEQGGWLVPFEAMCAGLPVVVTSPFIASSIIHSNRLGIVTNKLHEGVHAALEEDFSPAEQWVRENLTWEKFGESMIKVFEEASYERS